MGRKKGFNWKSREVVKTEIVKNEDVSYFPRAILDLDVVIVSFIKFNFSHSRLMYMLNYLHQTNMMIAMH